MILPTTLSLINATFRGRERGIAFAVWGSTIGGMAAVGPLLGGWLTTELSWRWAFGINVPLGIIIVIGVLAFVNESREPARQRLDLVGAALSVVTFGALVFGLIEGRTYGGWAVNETFTVGSFEWPLPVSPVPLAFAIAALALVAFIVRGVTRTRRGESSLLEFSLFRISSFRNGNIAALVVALGEFGIILSLPLWLQFVLGFDALQTGFVLLALAAGSFVASGFAGASSGKASPVELSGQGSGTQSTSRQVGSALGVAILGTILFTTTGASLGASLDDAQLPAEQRDQVVSAVVDSAGGAIAGLGENPATADFAGDAKAALSDGTRASAFTAAAFLALGLAATLRLGSGKRADESEGQEPASSKSSG